MSLIEHVRHIIQEQNHSKEEKFLLAVSGGKDSMVLFHIFYQLKLDFAVAHMNYGLREEAADLDEDLVKKFANQRDIQFFSKKVNTKAFCEQEGCSTQEGARILRYSWFEELLATHKLQWIVTAHHEEDNKETFIQNLKRGSGLRGLKAMQVVHENRLKPLLEVSRESIDAYAVQQAVEFREDASNNQNHYQRNLIRNQLLPKLEEKLPRIGKGILTSIKNLQADYDYLLESLEKEKTNHLEGVRDGWKVMNYKSLHPRLLFHILENFGFNYQQVQDLLRSTSSGKHIHNDRFIAADGHGDLYINHQEKEGSSFDVMELKEVGIYDLGSEKIQLSEAAYPSSFDGNKAIAYVDADALKWPLIVRNYRAGDSIQPIGMKGSKKLSDYFTDEKIPVHRRAQQKVVVSGDKIVWVVGEVVSDLAKLTASTKKVLKFETFK